MFCVTWVDCFPAVELFFSSGLCVGLYALLEVGAGLFALFAVGVGLFALFGAGVGLLALFSVDM